MGITSYFDKNILKNKRFEIKDTILVTGTPRSGTTWLMEMLGAISGYTYIYEPLNPIWFPEAFKTGFKSRTYIDPKDEQIAVEEYLRKAFAGKIYSKNPPYQPNIEMILHRIFATKLIVKSVNLTRLLPWIAKRYKLKHTFFVVRHPCAVINSQLRTGFFGYRSETKPHVNILPTFETIMDEIKDIKTLNEQLANVVSSIKTKEELLAVVWCLDNLIPLSYPKPYPWTLVIYEQLIKHSDVEIKRIFDAVGEDIPKSAYSHLNAPSFSTRLDEKKIVKDEDKQLSKWEKHLSKEQIQRIYRVVSQFGFDFYANDKIPEYDEVKITPKNDNLF